MNNADILELILRQVEPADWYACFLVNRLWYTLVKHIINGYMNGITFAMEYGGAGPTDGILIYNFHIEKSSMTVQLIDQENSTDTPTLDIAGIYKRCHYFETGLPTRCCIEWEVRRDLSLIDYIVYDECANDYPGMGKSSRAFRRVVKNIWLATAALILRKYAPVPLPPYCDTDNDDVIMYFPFQL